LAKRALVTGGTGQDGSYLIDLLLKRGYVVHAQSRQQRADDRSGVSWHIGNLIEASFLERLIATTAADEIYNLAAISRPALSWNFPVETARLNAFVPLQICELIRQHSPTSRFFQASSSEIFGQTSEPFQNESTYCDPTSPYGIAKQFAHRMVGAYRQQYGLHLSSGIMFNHESPRRPLSFVSQKIAHAAAALYLGLTETAEKDERGQPLLSGGKLRLGGLETRRDFGFAGDYVEAIYTMLQAEIPDDYVIGTGESHSIAEFCDVAFRLVGLDWKEHVVVDRELIRRADPAMRADASKLKEKLGWQARMSFNDLVSSMVRYQIDAIRQILN
jgi:GDPmannose 4,6-dehydratase